MNAHRVLMWIMVALIIILSGFNLYLTYRMSATSQTNKTEILSGKSDISDINTKIDNLKSTIDSVNQPTIDHQAATVKGKDGYNGKDGADGVNGKDSISTHTIEKETIIKEVPIPGPAGLTPEINCNKMKNRWEIKYGLDKGWQLLGSEPVKCSLE